MVISWFGLKLLTQTEEKIVHKYLRLVWYIRETITIVLKATHKNVYDLIYQTNKLWTVLDPSIFYWHHMDAKGYNIIQIQHSTHTLIKYSSKLQLLLVHETKYTIYCKIFKDKGNSKAFSIMLMVQYILTWVIHYL